MRTPDHVRFANLCTKHSLLIRQNRTLCTDIRKIVTESRKLRAQSRRLRDADARDEVLGLIVAAFRRAGLMPVLWDRTEVPVFVRPGSQAVQ